MTPKKAVGWARIIDHTGVKYSYPKRITTQTKDEFKPKQIADKDP